MNTLVISDLHSPYIHPEAAKFLGELKKKYNPKSVVCIGDILDEHTLSRFQHSTKSSGPAMELNESINALLPIYKIFPEVKVCLGNHDLRYRRQAETIGIPGDYIRELKDVIKAPVGWEFAESWDIGGVHYFHGDGFTGNQAALNVIKTKFKNTVYGHTHQASIQYFNGLWSMNVGCLINPDSFAFEYAKNFKSSVALGCGIITNDGFGPVPHYFPLITK